MKRYPRPQVMKRKCGRVHCSISAVLALNNRWHSWSAIVSKRIPQNSLRLVSHSARHLYSNLYVRGLGIKSWQLFPLTFK